MGKKRARKQYISKGQRHNVSRDLIKSISREASPFFKEANLRKAWKAGKNPWITVKNAESGTNKPYIRYRANSYWGNPKATVSPAKGANY